MSILTLWTGLGMKPLPPERWTIPGWEICWLEIAPPLTGENMDQWTERMFQRIPPETTLLGGFSLGAQLALKHQAMDPVRFPGVLVLSGFVSRRQWHPMMRLLRFLRIPQLLLRLSPGFLLTSVNIFMLLLPATERRRFSIVLKLLAPAAWRKILRFLLDFEIDSNAPVLQVCGADDILLKPAPPAVRLPDTGHFMLPAAGVKIGWLLQEWWNERKKTG